MDPKYARQHPISKHECNGPACMKRLMNHKSSSATRKRKLPTEIEPTGAETDNDPLEKIQSHQNPRTMGAASSAEADDEEKKAMGGLVGKYNLKKKKKSSGGYIY